MTAGRRQLIRDELEEGLIVSADVPSKLLDTVMRDWSMARAWLLREMDEGPTHAS